MRHMQIPVQRQLEAMRTSEEIMHLFNLDAIWTRLLETENHISSHDRGHAIKIGTEMKELLTHLPGKCGDLLRANAAELQGLTAEMLELSDSAQAIGPKIEKRFKDLKLFEHEIHDDAKKDIDLLETKLSRLKSVGVPEGDINWGCGLAIVATVACVLSGNEVGAVAFVGVAVHHCRR